MPGRLVDILLIGIEKGIDGGDDMPGLCVRTNDQMRESVCSKQSYVGERSGGEHSSVDWKYEMLRTPKADEMDRVSLQDWVVFCVKEEALGDRLA
jgi:hypothetical protein